jgi:transglutaminase-like putative cysteine protease
MTTAAWIPRQCLGWLLAAQLALIAPHAPHLPVWSLIAWIVCALWRVQVYRGQWSFPHRMIKIGVVIVCLAGIRFNYGSFVGLEPTVALLISCFCLKLVEASTRREAYLLLFLGYFVALTEFLFEQGFGTVLYMVLPILLLTAALIALQQDDPLRFSWQPLRTAAVMSAQAVPLLLLLFLVFPRIAPLWHVPLPGSGARTGMSDHLSPGDIAQLSQSDALAFRARFSGAVPPQRELYWRGLVLDVFDGRTWRANAISDAPLQIGRDSNVQYDGMPIEYEVFLEPTYQNWLYALGVPEPLSAHAVLTADFRLRARDIVTEKISYRARSYPHARIDVKLNRLKREYETELPKKNNPRARAWAHELRERFSDDRALINFLLDNFSRQQFFYTLQPPQLGENSVDEFLFDTRRGFCEHYASSFVFLLRAAGIPARVVAGYQGGEINPVTGTVLVHQFDAHAWAEAWLEGEGWVRFDPTAAVAPQRVENGLERAVSADEFLAQQPLSIERFRAVSWMNAVRWRIDAMNYAWTRWVVNYRDDTQLTVLNLLIGEINPARMTLLLVGGGSCVIFIVACTLFGRRLFGARLPPEQRYYAQFCARLAQHGYPRAAAMAPGAYARWVLSQQPQWRTVKEITACFEALNYRRLSAPQRQQLLKKLKRLIRSRDLA